MCDATSARILAEKYIDYQPRTSAEVRRRLAKAGFDAEIVDSVVDDLERAGLLDDSKFSADWVESRTRTKKLGRIRLASELRARGVRREDAEGAIQSIDSETELASALALAKKKHPLDSPLDRDEKRRLTAYLQRRGFNWEIIEQVFARLLTNMD